MLIVRTVVINQGQHLWRKETVQNRGFAFEFHTPALNGHYPFIPHYILRNGLMQSFPSYEGAVHC